MAESDPPAGTEYVACAICGTAPQAIVATHDRYGLPTRIVQCVRCGLRFINPRMTAAQYAEFYRHGYRPLIDRFFASAGQRNELQIDQRQYAGELLALVRRHIGHPASVVDVGGSTGIVGRTFQRIYGCAVTVIDPAPDELQHATGCQTICASAETAEFPQADLALLCRTVDHLLDPVGVLRRLRQVTQTLVVDAMDVDRWAAADRYKVDHPYAFTKETLTQTVRAAGWAIRHEWARRNHKYVGLVCSPQE